MIPRYTRPEMGGIWTDENRFAIWLEIENAILDGVIANDYEAAKAYLMQIKDEIVAAYPLTSREQSRIPNRGESS